MLGSRSASAALEFIADLASRLRHRVQLTSDGHRPYLEAVEASFGADIDYAYFAYNFIKIHRTLRVSPAMAANVTERLFDVSDIVALLEEAESRRVA